MPSFQLRRRRAVHLPEPTVVAGSFSRDDMESLKRSNAQLKAESQRHYEMLERARAALAEERLRCQNVLLQIAAFEAERQTLQQDITSLKQQVGGLQIQVTDLGDKNAQLQLIKAQNEAEIATLNGVIERLRQSIEELAAAAQELNGLRAALSEKTSSLERIDEELKKARTLIGKYKSALQELSDKVAAQDKEIKFLRKHSDPKVLSDSEGDTGITPALDPDGLSDVSTIDWDRDLDGDDVDDIGVLHSVMAAAGYGTLQKDVTTVELNAAGGGGRKVRERSVLDPSWRLRVAPNGTLGLDSRVPIPDLFWRVGMSRRQAVEEFKKVFRLLTKYKRDLRRVYRFYASIGAKSRVKGSGGRMGILQWGNLVADTKILARDEANMHGRGLATSANMTQTVCDTIFLHSCAMQVRASSANKQQQASSSKHLIAAQRWNPSSDAPPVPPSAAAVDVARGEHGEAFIGSLLALNRKGFYAALCRVAAQMRSTDPLPDALANLLRYHVLPRTCNLDGIPQFRRNEEDKDMLRRPYSASSIRPLSPWTRLLDRGSDDAGVLLTTRISESKSKPSASEAEKADALSKTRPQPQYSGRAVTAATPSTFARLMQGSSEKKEKNETYRGLSNIARRKPAPARIPLPFGTSSLTISALQQRAQSATAGNRQSATPGGSRLGIALAAARERGMLGGDYSDDSAAGAGSPSMMLSPTKEVREAFQGCEDVTPLQSPGGVGDDDTFANFV